MVRFLSACVLVLVACGFGAELPPPMTQLPIDAPTIEIDAAPDASPASLCTARYGGAQEFELCDASPTACRFFVETDGGTCEALCASFGGTCTEAYDGSCGNISETVRLCTFPLGDQVCNCKP